MSCRQENFEECESGCAYNGINGDWTNLLMKVQCDTVSENSGPQFLCISDGGLDLEFRTLSANVTESAALLEVTLPKFLLQVNCEHWRCVNRRLPCCRGWLHACRRATVTGNVGQSRIPSLCLQHSLLVSLLCDCLHCTVSSAYTSVQNLATHMCHLPYNCHLHSQWARLRHSKVVCRTSWIVVAPALTETRRFGILLFHTGSGAEILGDVRWN